MKKMVIAYLFMFLSVNTYCADLEVKSWALISYNAWFAEILNCRRENGCPMHYYFAGLDNAYALVKSEQERRLIKEAANSAWKVLAKGSEAMRKAWIETINLNKGL